MLVRGVCGVVLWSRNGCCKFGGRSVCLMFDASIAQLGERQTEDLKVPPWFDPGSRHFCSFLLPSALSLLLFCRLGCAGCYAMPLVALPPSPPPLSLLLPSCPYTRAMALHLLGQADVRGTGSSSSRTYFGHCCQWFERGCDDSYRIESSPGRCGSAVLMEIGVWAARAQSDGRAV